MARFSSEVSRRRALAGGAGLLAGASAWLLACGGGGSKSGSSTASSGGAITANATQQVGAAAPAAASQGRKGGRFGAPLVSTSTHFNTFSNYQEGYHLSGIHVYDRPLTARLDKRRYVLEAAASIEQPDPLKVVIKLKPGMVYQNLPPVNGRAVKASDIVAVQEYVKTLTTAENNGFQRSFLAKAEATDDSTVVYTLAKPFAYLFASTQLCNPTGQAMVPRELLDNLETNKPVGSGAYQLVEAQLNSRYLWKRNETYREASKGLPYIDEHETLVLNDPVALEAALRSEQVLHWYNVPPSIAGRVAQEMGAKIIEDLYVSTGLLPFNMQMEKAPWTDIRVREAFYRATNRQQFVNLVYNGKAVVPNGPLHASLEAYQLDPKESEPFYKNDLQAARQLLTAAGWDFNKEWEIIVNDGAINNTAAQVWQQQLAQAGIKVRPQPLPFAEWLPNRIGPGKFDLILSATPGGDTPYRAMRNQHSDTLDVYNHVGLQDKQLDALIEKSEAATNFEENVKLVKEIQMEALKKYSGTYNIVTAKVEFLRNPKLKNYEADILYGQVFRQEMWIDA